jgi:hypothetical protein
MTNKPEIETSDNQELSPGVKGLWDKAHEKLKNIPPEDCVEFDLSRPSTKTISDYLTEMSAAGYSMTQIVEAIDSRFSISDESMDNGAAAQYLSAARNGMQTALLYLRSYEEASKPIGTLPSLETNG